MITDENFNDLRFFKQTRSALIAHKKELKAPVLVRRPIHPLVPLQRPLDMLEPETDTEDEESPYIQPQDDKLKRQEYVADQKARKCKVVLVRIRCRPVVRRQRALLPLPDDIEKTLEGELQATFIGGSGIIASSANNSTPSFSCFSL